MVHEISPNTYYPEFNCQNPSVEHYSLAYEHDTILVKLTDKQIVLPKFSDMQHFFSKEYPSMFKQAYYLFSIDTDPYFLISLPKHTINSIPVFQSAADAIQNMENNSLFFMNLFKFRDLSPISMVFAGATGSHIARWRNMRRFCGVCGAKTQPSLKERSLVCPACGQVEYPKISPAVIVAIVNQDKLLLVRTNYGPYRKLSLVAGFVEIGESFEEAVHREVMEEVGLKVKNIKYYKSQPWAFSDTEMIGFTAELDGDDTITLQESELSEGGWFSRDEIPETSYRLSVGSEMIHLFKNNRLS